ncbi:hypothetical protein THAOC_13623, partial [Thalassiosira oceanica]
RSSWEEKVQKSAGASKDAAAVSSSRLWTLKRKIDINVSSEPTQGVYVPRSCGACEFYPVKRERIFLPRTEYIYHVMVDIEENRQCDYGHCDDNQRAITAVIRRDGKAAVAPFFKPLDVSYFQTLTYFAGAGDEQGSLQLAMEKGMPRSGSAVEQMEAFNKYFEEQDDYHHLEEEYDTIPELEWLIKELKNALKD